MTLDQLETVLSKIYRDGERPRPLHLLAALTALASGVSLTDAARSVATSAAHLKELTEAVDPVAHLLGEQSSDHQKSSEKVRASIAQRSIGSLSEQGLEGIYRRTVGSTELQLRGERSGGGYTADVLL